MELDLKKEVNTGAEKWDWSWGCFMKARMKPRESWSRRLFFWWRRLRRVWFWSWKLGLKGVGVDGCDIGYMR